MASLLGKIPTESVRRRISLLRRSWGLLDQICLHTSTGKAAVGQQVGSCGLEVVGSLNQARVGVRGDKSYPRKSPGHQVGEQPVPGRRALGGGYPQS